MNREEIANFFKNKKITLMGLGVLGRGVGDAAFLAERGAELLVTDLKNEKELSESLSKLRGYSNISFRLGEHKLEDFKDREMILKAAGVPLDSPYIAEARRHNVPVEMSTALFARMTPAKLVGVTGTRGKSTTAQLIHNILKKAGFKTLLGGNIQGMSTLAKLPEADENTVAVLELDSWQLQGFGENKISPSVAVFTNFLPDHLNYYGGDMEMYFNDKANICKNQHDGDVIIAGKYAAGEIGERYPEARPRIKEVTSSDLPEIYSLNLPGEHNRLNAAFARAVAEELGVGKEVIKEVIENFEGVPGRLEKIGEIDEVSVYNDTTSTTPDATAAALEALGGDKKAVLIAGGADKGLDMGKMASAINNFCKYVAFLSGEGTQRFLRQNTIQQSPYEEFSGLQEATEEALRYTDKGDTLLFSPGFPSFNMFRNEFNRGEEFNRIIEEYQLRNS